MFNLFEEADVIRYLKAIIDRLEENKENKQMLYAYVLETGKVPVKCGCEGLERLKCEKCRGTGYYLVEKEDSKWVWKEDLSWWPLL